MHRFLDSGFLRWNSTRVPPSLRMTTSRSIQQLQDQFNNFKINSTTSRSIQPLQRGTSTSCIAFAREEGPDDRGDDHCKGGVAALLRLANQSVVLTGLRPFP